MARLPRYRSALATSVAAFYRASPGLTVLTLVIATGFGLLQPAFVVATVSWCKRQRLALTSWPR